MKKLILVISSVLITSLLLLVACNKAKDRQETNVSQKSNLMETHSDSSENGGIAISFNYDNYSNHLYGTSYTDFFQWNVVENGTLETLGNVKMGFEHFSTSTIIGVSENSISFSTDGNTFNLNDIVVNGNTMTLTATGQENRPVEFSITDSNVDFSTFTSNFYI